MRLSRRQVLALGGALVVPLPASAARAAADPVADVYRRVLHLHTRWVEQQWDAQRNAYRADDARFTVVLGNAVLLTSGDFDARLAGVPAGMLRRRTLDTIERYASTNRLAGGSEWGRDAAVELPFVLAARLMWADLSAAGRRRVQRIVTAGEPVDMLSSTLRLAWGLETATVRERFASSAARGGALPAADRANLARVDGMTVRDRSEGRAMHDTFLMEYDGAVDPHHQADLWRSAARSAIHFLTAGRELPEVLLRQPNGDQLWHTLKMLATDAGVPVPPMSSTHYHRYGTQVLPLAFLAQVQGRRDAARAEADLAARLEPYLRHRPEHRLTKFGGFGDSDAGEAQARCDLAVAYLFHLRRSTPVTPMPAREFFAGASGTRDFGEDVGLAVQQTVPAFAAAVTRPGHLRFLWQPGHDDWLVDTRVPAFLPAGVGGPTGTWTTSTSLIRDGVDSTATVLTFGDRYAGFATLPTGNVVYATTGVGTDEGVLSLFNVDMPGMPGLTGERRFTHATGTLTLSGELGGGGDGGIDELRFPPRGARYVRMQGRASANPYGYSLWTFSVLDTAGADLAQGALVGASSADVTYPTYNATDGNPETRWAVDRTQYERQDSWIAVDLGSEVTVAGVRLEWEAAYGRDYVVQTSLDAVNWSDAATVPLSHRLSGGWVRVDEKFGLVAHGSDRPITVSATGVIAATGPAAPALIEGYAGSGADLAALARRRIPRASGDLRVADTDGYLSVFNLGPDDVTGAEVTLPSVRRLYRGVQAVRTDGLLWTVAQPAGTARVEPPRFTLDADPPIGARFTVGDSHHLTVRAPTGEPVALTVRAGSWSARITVPPGRTRAFTVAGGPITPTADLARGRTTFPTSPLPAGMTSPARAVDGAPLTSWRPGPSGRMVVDLGEVRSISMARLTWTGGRRRPVRVERSTDGLTYTTVARSARPGRLAELPLRASARYVALVVDNWTAGDAELTELSVYG